MTQTCQTKSGIEPECETDGVSHGGGKKIDNLMSFNVTRVSTLRPIKQYRKAIFNDPSFERDNHQGEDLEVGSSDGRTICLFITLIYHFSFISDSHGGRAPIMGRVIRHQLWKRRRITFHVT